MKIPALHAVVLGAAMSLGVGTALADRPPTTQERASIESELKKLGYQRWGSIEEDDGYWEVDNAHHSDGGKYDLKLDLKTLAVVKRDKDD